MSTGQQDTQSETTSAFSPAQGLFSGQQPAQQQPIVFGQTANAGQSQEGPAFSFNLGQTDKKNKVSSKEKIEQRQEEVFGNAGGDNVKRAREQFSIDLRKQKREEQMKAKRANTMQNTTGIPVTLAAKGDATSGAAQTQFNSTGLNGPASNAPLIDIGIDQALQFIGQVSNEEFINEVQKMRFKIGDFQRLVNLLQSDQDLIILFATIGMRRLLSFENDPPFQQFIDVNLVPKFITFLARSDLPKLQLEAAWCLTNIASGSDQQVQVLISKGMIDCFVKLLETPHVELIEQVIWGLGNMAGDGPRIRNLVISAGAVNPISEYLDRAPAGSTFTRNASWALSNMCRGRPAPDFEQIKRATVALAKVLKENDSEEIIGDVCWALSYISDGGVEQIPTILQTNVLPRIVELLEHKEMAISVSCLRTIGNILTGSDAETQVAIEAGALNAMDRLITNQQKAVRKEVCWSVSNITAGNVQQIQMALDIGLIDKLVHILIHDDNDVRKEAIWALSNSTQNASPAQFKQLVHKNALQAFNAVLKIQDPKTLIVAMEGVENILKCGQEHFLNAQGLNEFALALETCGGLDQLEELQMHKNHQIYDRSLMILETYFNEEQANVDEIMQLINNNGAGNEPKNTYNF